MSSNLLGDNSIQEEDLPELSIGSHLEKSGLGEAISTSSQNATPREDRNEQI